jgi:hypothetical protein
LPGSGAIAGTAAVAVTSATIAAGKTTLTIGPLVTSVGGVVTSVAAVGMSVGIALNVAHHQPGPRQGAVPQAAFDIAVEREEPLNEPPSNPRKAKTSHQNSEVAPVQAVPAVAADLEIAPLDESTHDVSSLEVSNLRLEPTPRAKPEARPRPWTTFTELEKASYRDTVNRWKGGLDKCKRAARQRGALDVAGELQVKLVLGIDGHAKTVDANSETVLDEELIGCVEREIKRWKFPLSSNPVVLDLTLDFAP